MKILVPVKRVVDYNVKIRVDKDTNSVDLNNIKMSMNPFDEIAVEEAIRIKEKGQCDEIVVVSLGPEQSKETIRNALAMGADRGILIKTEHSPEPLIVAKALAKLVQQDNYDLIILGKQSIDDDCNQTGQMLSALLNCSVGTYASKIDFDNDSIIITREIDGGLQTLKLSKPSVVTADLRLNVPRYASLPNIMKAKQKTIDELDPQDLGIDMNPKLVIKKVEEPPKRIGGGKVESIEELIDKLKNEAGVI
ncbi:MAG: electron transfer flavoprotein subunit beta/FixA family protein [Hyphomicrobiales bacterium]|jgi:electron transfer flavoprotein beta subunit|nr:electron transfer flavoprotein subunit beta/FixA family protein [Hyphomicrobiales bacterium]